MLPIPQKCMLVAGHGEGRHKLTAFDAALLDAGVGNLNLIRVSSILPPGAVIVEEGFPVPAGALTPTAYGTITCDEPGTLISAAIGVGVARDSHGVIMEFSGLVSAAQAAETVAAMVREGFEKRGLELADLKAKATEHRVEADGCAFAAAVLWY